MLVSYKEKGTLYKPGGMRSRGFDDDVHHRFSMSQSPEEAFEEDPFGPELPSSAVAYLRTSRLGHEDGRKQDSSSKEGSQTIEAQQEKILRWARRREIQDVAFFEDMGECTPEKEDSSDKEELISEREGLQALLSAVRDQKIRLVIVTEATRLTGSLQRFLQVVGERFTSEGVRLVSIEDRLDTGTETGRRFLRMLGSFRQASLDRFTERTQEGHRQKAKSGGHAYGEVPFGYQKDEDGNLEPAPDQARVVREIFHLRENGESLRSIAGHLTDEKIPTKRGGKWHASTVKSILDNPIYRGRLIYEIDGETVDVEAESLRLLD